MTSDKDLGVETVESANSGRPTKGGRVKRHCARWWWLHLIIVIVVALAITLGLIFGAIPKIGQDTINKSSLTVNAISINAPANDHFTFGINSTIKGNVPVKSHLNPQNLSMFLVNADGSAGTPFMYLQVPKLDLHDTIPLNIANYPMQIANLTAYTEFTSVVVGSETFTMGVLSKPQLYVGAVHNTVTYNKTVELKGFDKLSGVTISNVTIYPKGLPDGANMLSDVMIPNPSVFTIELGNLTMNIGAGSIQAGYGVVENLILRPGDNHYQVRATLLDNLVQGGAILLNAVLSDPKTPITLIGNSTVYDGVHISWFETPLNSLALNVTSPGPGTIIQ